MLFETFSILAWGPRVKVVKNIWGGRTVGLSAVLVPLPCDPDFRAPSHGYKVRPFHQLKPKFGSTSHGDHGVALQH